MRTLMKVTQTDINKGCRAVNFNCPVARAIRRQYTNCHYCSVYYDATVEILVIDPKTANSKMETYKLPRSVLRFIKRFDKFGKKAVKPFNFYLEKI